MVAFTYICWLKISHSHGLSIHSLNITMRNVCSGWGKYVKVDCYRQATSSEHIEKIPHGLLLCNSILVKIDKPRSSQKNDGRVLVYKTSKYPTKYSKLKPKLALSLLIWMSGQTNDKHTVCISLGKTQFHRQNSGTIFVCAKQRVAFGSTSPKQRQKTRPAPRCLVMGLLTRGLCMLMGKKSKGPRLKWTKVWLQQYVSAAILG